LAKFIKPDLQREPGDNLDYNSSNADLIGWLISRVSGQPFQDYIQKNIWSKLGAEHDGYIAVDRAFMPVVTGGMNSTTRDAAKFAMMVRDRGAFNGQQIIPSSWIDETLNVSEKLRKNMSDNLIYSEEPWTSYHNMWWVIDEKKGEFCAMGIHGQVMYINRSTDTVMVWFSSQPVAGNPRNANTQSKLKAARQLATYLGS
jgi:CubicO group peptidase (beta-lactamase class C family)